MATNLIQNNTDEEIKQRLEAERARLRKIAEERRRLRGLLPGLRKTGLLHRIRTAGGKSEVGRQRIGFERGRTRHV